MLILTYYPINKSRIKNVYDKNKLYNVKIIIDITF